MSETIEDLLKKLGINITQGTATMHRRLLIDWIILKAQKLVK